MRWVRPPTPNKGEGMMIRLTFRDGKPDQLYPSFEVSINYHNRVIIINPKNKNCVSVFYPFENISYWREESK